MQQWPQTLSTVWAGWGSIAGSFTDADQTGCLTVARWPQRVPWPSSRIPTPAWIALALLLSEAEVAWHSVKGNWANWNPNLQGLLQHSGSWLHHIMIEQWRWLNFGEPWFTLSLASSLLNSSPTPYLADINQHRLEKDVTFVHVKFSALNKPVSQVQVVYGCLL